MKKNAQSKVSIFALGGLGEVGKNMYVVQCDNDIIVIDSGLMFPDSDMLGIDVVIPDITYLVENSNKVRGIILTHGHEDHIGGLPYILKKLNVPLYATKLTMGLVENKLKEAQLLNSVKRIVVSAETDFRLGNIKVSLFNVNHSIPDAVGVCLETPEGRVVHTGDFKFDLTPVGRGSDFNKMSWLGARGVLCLLSDSTNAEKTGFTGSEASVGRSIEAAFRKADQKVIVSTFASNVYRVQQVIDAAIKTDRKLAVLGRSMLNVISVASDLGYLDIPEGMLIETDDVRRLPSNKIAIISTGSQGEVMAALTRMANGSHRKVEIHPGDTVIIAASPIPGNERAIGRTIDQIFKLGADVIYSAIAHIHVSGHGSQEDLRLMLSLLQPKYFIPIHGEYRMLRAHGKLAEEIGVKAENIFLCDNGDTIEFSGGRVKRGPKITAGKVLIDGLGVGDIGNIVLRDRKLLSQDGIMIVVLTISKEKKIVIAGPDMISRGFVYIRESEALLKEANEIVKKSIDRCTKQQTSEWASLKTVIRDSLGKFLFEKTKRRPMILPVIMEV